jgi:hypothetical protein
VSAVNDRTVGRWVVAIAAAFMVGGYLGSAGTAQASDEPGGNAGSPGRDGQSVTCHASQHDRQPICGVVGADGEDGAPGAVHS